MGKFERFLTGFTSIKANYQVYDRGDWPLSLGYFIIYRLLTKLENVSDHVRFFPEVGGGRKAWLLSPPGVTLVPTTICLLIFLTFFGLRQEHKSSNTYKKWPDPSLALEFLLLFTFEFRVKQVSLKRTQIKHVNLWMTDWRHTHALAELRFKNATTSFQTLYRHDMVINELSDYLLTASVSVVMWLVTWRKLLHSSAYQEGKGGVVGASLPRDEEVLLHSPIGDNTRRSSDLTCLSSPPPK